MAQAKALVALKSAPLLPRSVVLTPTERAALLATHKRRLLECVSKQCLNIIRTMMQHKARAPRASQGLGFRARHARGRGR